MADLREALEKAVREAKAPGAVALVGRDDETYFHAAAGSRQLTPDIQAATIDTVYDIASLTKVIATTTFIMLLVEQGKIELDAPADTYLPIPAFRSFTVRHLLTHTAGLPSGRPYYKECTSVLEMLQRYADGGIDWTPGTRWRYSDVGFMILGQIVEHVAGESLDAFATRMIFEPLGMTNTRYKPPVDWFSRCAATENCAWRGKVMLGEVHDENAYAVGGVSGHAGLFSTAGDLGLYCRALLKGTLLRKETVDQMATLGAVSVYPWQGLGWLMDPWDTEGQGHLPSRRAIGHTGWTGTCLWLDLDTGIHAILLSNTCHPSRAKRNNPALRSTFYDAVVESLYPVKTTTHSGLDRLVRDRFDDLRGKRVALLTNHASVDQLGRHILDVLALDSSIRLQTIYSPEHGVRGQAEAGEKVGSETAAVEVISLYGERREPSRDELSEIDVFVVDLQDVGSRYFTYMATMKACLAACGAASKPVVVLDRPNPVGGELIEGPVAERTDSLVCSAKIPARHGMTMGELARYFVDTELGKSAPKLKVLKLDTWRRRNRFDDISLPWVAPSPNMVSPTTALLYTGTCLFEGTNLNEGRGTETPFEIIGAPWLDATRVIELMSMEDSPGCTFSPEVYIPRAIPGKASSPRYMDQTCQGIRIRVYDVGKVQGFRLAVSLLVAIHRAHSAELAWESTFDILAGTPSLREQIEQGVSAGAICESFRAGQKAFQKTRGLLYA